MANPALLAVHHARPLPLTVRRSGLRPSGFRPTGNRLTVPPMSPPPGNAIEVHGLTKRYGDVLAVDDIAFAAPPGATVGLLGGNGAGKTTTIAMLLGLLLPTSGTIHVLGHDMLRDRFAALARMNFSSPYVSLPHRLTVRENLRVYGHLYNVRGTSQRIAELAAELDLGPLLDRPAGQLSAGQKTRVALAKSLINRPELLLLDEPTASLDPDTGDLVRSWLERYRADTGCTILLASHNMAEVERLCSHVLMLKQGRVVDRGAPQDLLDRYGRDDLEEVFLDIARDRRTARGSGVQPDAVPA
jgi:ABC-2 type transport system ATP-binding protein